MSRTVNVDELRVRPLWHRQVCRGACCITCFAGELLVGGSQSPALKGSAEVFTLLQETGEVHATYQGLGYARIQTLIEVPGGEDFWAGTSAGSFALCSSTRSSQMFELPEAAKANERSKRSRPEKQVTSELQALLSPQLSSREGPDFVAEGGFRGVRPGYAFRHGSHGLGYYRTDKLVQLEAHHHDWAPSSAETQQQMSDRSQMQVQPQDSVCVTSSQISDAVSGTKQREDGKHILSGSYDRTIRVWNTADGSHMRTLSGHRSGVRALLVAVKGHRFFSASSDNTIRIWDMRRWVCLRAMNGRHADTTWPSCLALSPDGAMLASGSTGPFGQATIKIFNTQGECLATCAHLDLDARADMTGLAFNADSRVLFSAASDGTVAAWGLEPVAAPLTKPGLRRGFM
ncbi:hypothetical protein WJX84_002227 [Apatococcus fuscideae]|uniref:Uncharacterized protein n=1 Tax=Apatococcus fuscideae TaxID=2026836 RepID=A0AAW1SY45_9CHLO